MFVIETRKKGNERICQTDELISFLENIREEYAVKFEMIAYFTFYFEWN